MSPVYPGTDTSVPEIATSPVYCATCPTPASVVGYPSPNACGNRVTVTGDGSHVHRVTAVPA